MKNMKFFALIMVAILFVSSNVFSQRNNKKESKIQVALIMDTSSSMDGLIDQAKTQLWSVVNELATARYEGEMPILEIALYEYGNDDLPYENGYIRQVSGLTTDLDKLSENLFSLKTNGGSEFCGYVIDKATIHLEWSKSNDDLKMIFIAGNEEFTQGEHPYEKACKDAITKGIVINTIFCGDIKQGINMKWKHASELADGKYLNIDQDQAVAYISSPFDEKIVELNNELNNTYIAFGRAGKNRKEMQASQDMNAATMNSGASVTRAVSKSSALYNNSGWDLVDAAKDNEEMVSKLEKEDLPDEMKGMNDDEKIKYIENKKVEREEIQTKIQELNKQREEYVTKIKMQNASENTLGDAMIQAVREQATKKSYSFKK